MIFHVFIQPDYMYALLKELTNNYHKNVKCRVQKLNTLEFVLLPSIQTKTRGLVIYFSIDIIQIRLFKLLVGKIKLDFDCTTVVT